MLPLKGKVAVVAGSARGAGRGIACMLGAAGATVYCTARSSREQLVDPKRNQTIDDTAEMVTARGGKGIAVRVDHTDAAQVERLFERVASEQQRLDLLVNNLNADTLFKFKPFWTQSLDDGLTILETAIHAHIVNVHFAVPLMLRHKRGLIIEITDGDSFSYRGNLYYDLTKTNAIRLAMIFAQELRKKGIASVAVTPGFLRSEAVLEALKVKEENWRDAIPSRPEFSESETPYFVGHAIASLAGDPKVLQKSGRVFNATELAREYGFTDIDGRTPDVWSYIRREMPQFAMKKIDEAFYDYFGLNNDALAEELEKMQQ